MLGVLDFFGEDVGNIAFTVDVADIHLALFLGEADPKFSHIDVTELLGDGDSFCPVDAPPVVVPDRGDVGAVGETKVFEEMSDGDD